MSTSSVMDGYTIHHQDAATIVRFTSAVAFDRDHVDATQGALYALVRESQSPQLILNLEHVDYMNSASLGALIGLSKRVRQRPGRMILCSMTRDIHVLFDLTRLLQVFEICNDEQAALEKLKTPTSH